MKLLRDSFLFRLSVSNTLKMSILAVYYYLSTFLYKLFKFVSILRRQFVLVSLYIIYIIYYNITYDMPQSQISQDQLFQPSDDFAWHYLWGLLALWSMKGGGLGFVYIEESFDITFNIELQSSSRSVMAW